MSGFRQAAGRSLMLLGLVVTGMALLFGFFGEGRLLTERLGGSEWAELKILAVGALFFFAGRRIAGPA